MSAKDPYPKNCALCGKRVLRADGFFAMLLQLGKGPVSLHHGCRSEYLKREVLRETGGPC